MEDRPDAMLLRRRITFISFLFRFIQTLKIVASPRSLFLNQKQKVSEKKKERRRRTTNEKLIHRRRRNNKYIYSPFCVQQKRDKRGRKN